MPLWGGRFEEGVDDFTQRFGASLPIDKRMYAQDIAGSIAHAHMLAAQGIISAADADAIESGLLGIKADIDSGNFAFDINDEDIHMAIEAELTRRIGDAGARLHTGRSRNDQVATDSRLYFKQRASELMQANLRLREALVSKADAHMDVVMPGYTHMQHAQPVLFSHHMLAYTWMLARDFRRLAAARDACDMSPLGAAALAGTSYPLNRRATAAELGFCAPIPNSLDAVSDRDFLCDLLYACSVSAIHLTRMCEEIIMWSTSEFGFITLSDAYSTGSSIMPQKKNPDFAELIRGKSGRIIGDMVALLVTLKSLPLAYNKDLQEDKSSAMDAADTLQDCYICAAGMVQTMQINAAAMALACKNGHLAATDIADFLAKRGLPFRQAHEVVGKLVKLCDKRGCNLDDLTQKDFEAAHPLFAKNTNPEKTREGGEGGEGGAVGNASASIADCLDIKSIVDARTTYGGTATIRVQEQLQEVKDRLSADAAQI